MTATTTHPRGIGQGAETVLSCDTEGCAATKAYGDRRGLEHAVASGWRQTTPTGPKSEHVCPRHNRGRARAAQLGEL